MPGKSCFCSHRNIGCILVAELNSLALGSQTWIQFLATLLGCVTGHVLSEPVSTSVKWIIGRIKWGDGRGKRASYNRQKLLWSFVAPGEEELSPSPASVLIAVMSLLHRQQRHVLSSSCMPSTNTAHALPQFAAPRTAVVVPFLQLREMRHSGDLSRVPQLVGDRSRLEPC